MDHALEDEELEKIMQHPLPVDISHQWIAVQLGLPPKIRNNLVNRLRENLLENRSREKLAEKFAEAPREIGESCEVLTVVATGVGARAPFSLARASLSFEVGMCTSHASSIGGSGELVRLVRPL